MKKLLLSLLAALALLAAIGISGQSSASPVRPGDIATDAFGLQIDLDPAHWRAIEKAPGSPGKLVLEYTPSGKVCAREECSRLTISAPGAEDAYYELNVRLKFRTLILCNQVKVAWGDAAQQLDFLVGGKAVSHFIVDPCPSAAWRMPVDTTDRSQPRSFVWFLEDHLVMRFDEMSSGVRLEQTDLPVALGNATWL